LTRYRYEPSKPMAVFGIVVGVAMIFFALTSFDGGGDSWFISFWCAGVVAITALNTWAAFSDRGSLGTYVRVPDDEESSR
jgi:hypothetical protein